MTDAKCLACLQVNPTPTLILAWLSSELLVGTYVLVRKPNSVEVDTTSRNTPECLRYYPRTPPPLIHPPARQNWGVSYKNWGGVNPPP